MKYLVLLILTGLIFMAWGVERIDQYSLSITGPPPTDRPPELSYGPAAHPVQLQMEILGSGLPDRSLIYRFSLPSGTYDHLRWNGYGIPLPSHPSILNYWGEKVAGLEKLSVGESDRLASWQETVLLPPPSLLAGFRWFAGNIWIWTGAIVLFFLFQERVESLMSPLFAASSVHGQLKDRDGRMMLLTFLALSAVWFSLCLPGSIRFDASDDQAMEMLASGYVTGHPSEYLIFINVLIGFLFKGLYVLIPGVAWYPWVMLSATMFCLVASTRILLDRGTGERFWWLFLAGCAFGPYFITHLQFTVVSYLFGLLGMLILAERTSRASLVAAVVMLTMASLIRFDSFLLVVITTGGAAWLASSRRTMEKGVFFGAILVLGWSGKIVDQSYYNSHPDWRAFHHYNAVRGSLHMTPQLNGDDRNSSVYQHVGWSHNDLQMFKDNWLFDDQSVFSAEHLAFLKNHLSSYRTHLQVLYLFFAVIALAPAPILLFLIILLDRTGSPKRSVVMLALVLLPALGIMIYLAADLRLPARVAVPIVYGTSMFLLLAGWKSRAISKPTDLRPGLALVSVTLVVLALEHLCDSARENEYRSERLASSLQCLSFDSSKTFFASINSIPLERMNPLTALARTRNINIIYLIWSQGSPSFNLQLKRHGSTSLFQSLVDDPNSYLVIPTSEWNRAENFRLFVQEHDHEKINVSPLILNDGKAAVFSDFTVMKVVPAGRP